MSNQRTIEVFAAGCAACDEVIDLVNRIAAPGSTIRVLDMHDAAVAARAKALGIRSVPSVVIDGKLASRGSMRSPPPRRVDPKRSDGSATDSARRPRARHGSDGDPPGRDRIS